MTYKPRLLDAELRQRMKSVGAILIEGPKACGKTEMATQVSKSIVNFDTDASIHAKMQFDPYLVLSSETPILLDEWQTYSEIWNYVRREVDRRKQAGQFILTGSATPDDDVRRHSGVGRFSIIKLNTMSLYEMGWSTEETSLRNILNGEKPLSASVEFSLPDFAEKIMFGGWPALINKNVADARQFSKDYINLIAETDISKVSNTRRDPVKVKRLLQSVARNISTEATIATLTADTNGEDGMLDVNTVSDYLDTLKRLMIIKDQPAWSTHIRSSHQLRKTPKRHFADPSLCIGALNLSIDDLVHDINYLGLLFESLVIRDLNIYSEVLGATVYHYRDSSGQEVDAIIQQPNGQWSAFEIKLGLGAADEAAKSLLKFAQKIDTQKQKPPTSLNIITGNGFAHQRKDGVNVIPISTLML